MTSVLLIKVSGDNLVSEIKFTLNNARDEIILIQNSIREIYKGTDERKKYICNICGKTNSKEN